MRFEGRVVKKLFGRASKSEHEAVTLVTSSGEYVLRRQGGNPFQDDQLDRLVGKTVCCEGRIVEGYTLVFTQCHETGDSSNR